LTIHGFRSQGGSDQEDLLICPLCELVRLVEQLNLDASVLLRCDTFTLGSVMIGARLIVKFTEDCVAFTMLHLVLFFQCCELPFNVRVKEWVRVCSDERASPICEQPKILQIFHSNRREEINPVQRISEGRDLFFGKA